METKQAVFNSQLLVGVTGSATYNYRFANHEVKNQMDVKKYADAPLLKHLQDESSRALIVNLRHAVAPILDNNTLPHFTDHSVSHSDGVVNLVDELVNPIQSTSSALSNKELIVLYSACYLHDIGLQYEAAGETQTIRKLSLRVPWVQLTEDERRDILRKYHHVVSAEMVHSSVRAESPIIGIQLTNQYEPSRVACLCESHNLYFEVPEDLRRFNDLTEDGPNIRMRLLAGLLRIADILEESRRRAPREKAQTLQLNSISDPHWWRHYYTESIKVDENERTITIWFDFPPEKFSIYSQIVPELQTPWIEAELNRHSSVFNKNGLSWTLQAELKSKKYSDTEEMPEAVLTAMTSELRRRHLAEDESRRAILLSTFRESRPLIQARLLNLAKRKESLSPMEYLQELFTLSKEMWEIGSTRSALMNVVFEYQRSIQHLEEIDRVEMGTDILEMCLAEDLPHMADGWCDTLCEQNKKLDQALPVVSRCYASLFELYSATCNIPAAKSVIESAIEACNNQEKVDLYRVQLSEINFLQGDLENGDHVDPVEPNDD